MVGATRNVGAGSEGAAVSKPKSVRWRQYQDEVAAVFRAKGCDATTNATVEGARGIHEVDVRVDFDKVGIPCLWIVECKYWNTKVTKEKVMVLREIVEDCGADRGVLVSKVGFQSGAIRASQKTNITLTSIDDLQEYIDDKVAELSAQLAEYLCPHCGSALVVRAPYEDDEHSGLVESFECGFERGGWVERPCPFGTDFPKLEDFDLSICQIGADYICYPRAKTEMARRIELQTGYGRTAEEAREVVIEHYNYLITPPHQEFRGKRIFRSVGRRTRTFRGRS